MQKNISILILTVILLLLSGCGENAKTLQQPLSEASSKPSLLNGKEYLFAINDPEFGNELWRSDGTVEGTHIVKDIRTDTKPSNPIHFITYKDRFLFNADDGIHGRELHISDGTRENTFLLKDLVVGADSSYPSSFTIFHDKVYFSTINGLWCSDGTMEGTYQVYSLKEVHNMVIMNHKLYFIADSEYGHELWNSDGTSEGTAMVKNINPGGAWGVQSFLHVADDFLIFSGDDGIHGNELWRSDGTEEGTFMLKDIFSGSSDSQLLNLNGIFFKEKFYFTANGGSKNYGDRDVWVTDGTKAGTKQFLDLNGFSDELFSSYTTDDSSSFYFLIQNKLYKSDGTPEGTSILLHNRPGFLQGTGDMLYLINRYGLITPFPSNQTIPEIKTINLETDEVLTLMTFDPETLIGAYTIFQNELYFSTSSRNSQTLYRTDGTKNSTALVHLEESPFTGQIDYSQCFSFQNHLYFTVQDAAHDLELWRTNGTEAGTSLLKDINVNTKDATPNKGAWWKNEYYFKVNELSYNNGLYKTDGTEEGTERVWLFKDQEYINQIVAADSFLLVLTSKALWVTNGTAASMRKLPLNDSLRSLGNITLIEDTLYFSAYDGSNNFWKTDGTEAGTVILYPDIYLRSGITRFNDKMFFIGKDIIYGGELFVSDGTAEGTHVVKDINPGSSSSMYNCSYSNSDTCIFKTGLLIINNHLYFGASEGNESVFLWRSDGTAQGTVKVPDKAFSTFDQTTVLKNSLYSIDSKSSGSQIYKYDIVTQKPEILSTVGYQPKIIKKTENLLYLSITESQNSSYSIGLWKSDGTQNGTVKIKDFNSPFQSICSFNDTLFFTFYNENTIWVSNGTEEGTVPLIQKEPKADYLFIQHCHIMDEQVILDLIMRSYQGSGSIEQVLYSSDGTLEGTHRIP